MADTLKYATLPSIQNNLPEDHGASKNLLSNESYSAKKSQLHRPDDAKRVDLFQLCRDLSAKRRIYSAITMDSAGFKYTGKKDAAICDQCKLEVANWTLDMEPLAIHKQQSPTCPFIQKMLVSEKATNETMRHCIHTASISTDEVQPLNRSKTGNPVTNVLLQKLIEVDTLKQIRKRTFSHWSPRLSPSSSQMIDAGFFNCNVGDRVICIYCNLICQQWTPNIDDPCEVHKTLSPKCVYVMTILVSSETSSISIINEASTTDDSFRSQAIVYTAACNANYIEIPKRAASFATWPNENLPAVDDLVRAGFFFTGTKTVVTCFYCNGSLQNWGTNDNPMIEHARWFPNCAYAKQLCGAELYRKIQTSKKIQQEKTKGNDSSKQSEVGGANLNGGRLLIPDESTLSRFVAARLDLPVSQRLLDRKVKLSIIKRCWEDQLRVKHDDFESDSDLVMACTILQKQIEHIDGKKENIIVPSVAMKKIRERQQADAHDREQAASGSISGNSANINDVDMTTSSGSNTNETDATESACNTEEMNNSKSSSKSAERNRADSASPENPCVLCLEEERQLACLPCGHLATCVPCGHSLRSCPICRCGIDGFMRIYV